MTATTKEQRESLRRLDAAATAGEWWVDESDLQVWAVSEGPLKASSPICAGALPEDGELMATGRNALPALLSDSDRLAAIEAVTGEEVRELVDRCQEHLTMSKFLRKEHLLARANDDRELSATAILSLSAKVAEQAEEIERLRRESVVCSGCGRDGTPVGPEHISCCPERQMLTAKQWSKRAETAEDKCRELGKEIDRLNGRAEAAGDKCNVLEEEVAQLEEGYTDIKVVGLRVRSHYDTLRRLLTETAVPALERIERRDFLMADLKSVTTAERVASSALSTISAQMENSTAEPQPARCSTCDDTRVIYGHGSFEASCPACHDADAEAGLTMLGGDGRG